MKTNQANSFRSFVLLVADRLRENTPILAPYRPTGISHRRKIDPCTPTETQAYLQGYPRIITKHILASCMSPALKNSPGQELI